MMFNKRAMAALMAAGLVISGTASHEARADFFVDENGNPIPNISLSITINAVDGVLTPTPLPEGAATPTTPAIEIPSDDRIYDPETGEYF